MNTKLRYLYEQLEYDRTTLLEELLAVPQAKLDYQSRLGKWSISQILMHLLTSEQLTLAYLRKKSKGIDQLKNAGFLEAIKMDLLKISQRIPLIKYKAPRLLVQNTPESVPLHDLAAQWSSSRLELKNFLESIQDDNLHKLIYKHPVAGRFNVAQCLTFMREHFHHHLPQIKRLL